MTKSQTIHSPIPTSVLKGNYWLPTSMNDQHQGDMWTFLLIQREAKLE